MLWENSRKSVFVPLFTRTYVSFYKKGGVNACIKKGVFGNGLITDCHTMTYKGGVKYPARWRGHWNFYLKKIFTLLSLRTGFELCSAWHDTPTVFHFWHKEISSLLSLQHFHHCLSPSMQSICILFDLLGSNGCNSLYRISATLLKTSHRFCW